MSFLRSLSAEILSVDEPTITGFVYGSLEDEEISLNDLLVEKSFAVNISQENTEGQAELSDTVLSYANIPVKVGDKINLFYVTADSPASIWCQLSDSEADLLDLMEQLGAFYGSLGADDLMVEEPVTGMAVCAQFTEDDSWYRAEILQTGADMLVHFVDYGNNEELPRSRIKRFKQDFVALPKQAVSLTLSGVSPQSLEEWSEEKQVAMEELCSEKCYVGEILEITDTTLVVSLKHQDSDVMLLDELCKAKLISKLADMPAETTLETEEQPVDKHIENTLPLEEQPSGHTAALEEKTSNDTVALEEQTLEDTAALEEQTSEDTEALEEQTSNDTVALEEQISNGTVALEEQTLEDTAALEEQTSEDTEALEEQTSNDTVALEEQISNGTVALEEQTLEDTAALEEQTSEDTEALEEQTSEGTAALEEQISNDTVALEEQTLENTAALEEQTSEDTEALEEQTSEDTAAFEEQTSEDTEASEEQTSGDTTALEEQTSKDTVALEEQTSEDTAALEKQRLEDNTTFVELPSDEIVALEKQMSQKMEDSEEHRSEDNTALHEQTEQDIVTLNDSALDEQSVDNTATLEGKLRDKVGVLKENQVDGPPNLEEPIPDKRPFIRTQDSVVLPETIVNNNEDNNLKRETSGDNEEDLDDAEAVCHAIDCLLTEIDSRDSEGSHITKAETSSVIGAEHEEAIAIITNEEASDDEVKHDSLSPLL